MVSKLLLAVQEKLLTAWREGDTESTLLLRKAYREVRNGLGYRKSAELYGAFPADPYSHTPLHSGAKQPGMTGQVKEEILTRQLENGVLVSGGRIFFSSLLVDDEEFLPEPAEWTYYDIYEKRHSYVRPAKPLCLYLLRRAGHYRNREIPGSASSSEINGRRPRTGWSCPPKRASPFSTEQERLNSSK